MTLYSAVHMLLTIPEYQTSAEKIAAYFHAPLADVREVLKFLETRQLISLKNGRYNVQNNLLFINKDSPLFSHHQALERREALLDLHGSF